MTSYADRASRQREEARRRLKEAAVRYDVLLESVEKDTATGAAMVTRMSSRVWAYQTAATIEPGDSTVDLSRLAGMPPSLDGWIDLTYLLMSLGEFELADQSLHRGEVALNETRRLMIQFIIDEALERPLADPAP